MSAVFVPVVGMSPYVKKEDTKDYFRNHLIGQAITGVVYTIMNLFFVVILSSKLLSLNIENIQLYVNFGGLFMCLGVIGYWVGIAQSFSEDYKKRFTQKLSKYDNKEMVNMSKIIDQKRILWTMGVYLLFMLLGIVMYVLPIYLATGI